jgi:ubiquitin-protein ligase
MNEVKYDLTAFQNPRDIRLAKEHLYLHEVCERSTRISYQLPKNKALPPDVYEIHYRLRSIVGVDKDQQPIFGNSHKAEIALPLNYPIQGPIIRMLSPVWHPNIKYHGQRRVCSNIDNFGLTYQLGDLILRLGEMLQYKNYHALPEPPYPEDEQVARWVRDFAEPREIISKAKGIFTDDVPLIGKVKKVELQRYGGRTRMTVRLKGK